MSYNSARLRSMIPVQSLGQRLPTPRKQLARVDAALTRNLRHGAARTACLCHEVELLLLAPPTPARWATWARCRSTASSPIPGVSTTSTAISGNGPTTAATAATLATLAMAARGREAITANGLSAAAPGSTFLRTSAPRTASGSRGPGFSAGQNVVMSVAKLPRAERVPQHYP
jgi:hypothetical protein